MAMENISRQRLFEMLNNNLAEAMMGASNRMIEEAIEAFWDVKENKAIYPVMEAFRIRMCHHAKVLLIKMKKPDGGDGVSMMTYPPSGTNHYVVYTGFDKISAEADGIPSEIDLRELFEMVLVSGSDGLVINPGMENGFVQKDSNYMFRGDRVHGFPLFKEHILAIMKSYYNPRFRIEAVYKNPAIVSAECRIDAVNLSGMKDDCLSEETQVKISDYYMSAMNAAKKDKHQSILFRCIQADGNESKETARTIISIIYKAVNKWVRENTFCPMRILFATDDVDIYRLYLEMASV